MRTLNDGTPIPISRITVWYADGSKWSCDKAQEWPELPSEDVVLVQVLYAKEYKGKHLQEVLRGLDYYWERSGYIVNGNAKHMPRDVPEQSIKRGVLVEDAAYQRMYNAACEGVIYGGNS